MIISLLRQCRCFHRDVERLLTPKCIKFNKLFQTRNFNFGKSSSQNDEFIKRTNTVRNYTVALACLTLSCSFAAVPLYRIFCQTTGFGGTVKRDVEGAKIEGMKPNPKKPITVKFNSDVSSNMSWEFKPQQREIVVVPGETALAFYTATNPTDKPIIGISTYNVLPYNAARYFNKIQCFCFEEQLLNAHEQVDMPVFFYIDPEFCEDPQMEYINEIILSYTFFQAKEGLPLSNVFSTEK